MSVRYRGQPEDEPQQVVIEKPEGLSPHASAHWDCVFPKLEEMNILHPVDCPALVAMCEWWAEWKKLLSGEVGEEGYKRSIALASCFKNWSNLAGRFGLTPKDRDKLQVPIGRPDPVVAQYLR